MKTFGRIVLAAVLLGGGAYVFANKDHFLAKHQAQTKPAPLPVPVVLGEAEKQDFPITYDGIGTVQAFNTVTVRARVDGTLEKVLFQEGQDVKAGDVLAVIDPRPFKAALDQATAMKAKDEAQLANAKLDLKRFVDLRDFASKQSVDTQNALVAQLTASTKADDAAIENATVQLGYTTIASPINGRTGVRLIDAGNMIHASEGAALLVVTQMEPIYVTFTLPQDVLDAVASAQAKGPVKVEALKRDANVLLSSGTLSVVDNQIDTTTGTIRLKATFANKDRRLWPGAFVNVKVVTEIRRDATVVPSQAVQRGPSGYYVYVVKPDMTVEMRAIASGRAEGGVMLVEKGLSAGEKIVVDGQYKLQPGVKVQPLPAAAQTAPAG
ncbi:MAG TPA: efflux RND transporter periplasmic adaptor subunit [Methylovirgula sp.]|jgi:multidrug efflux system membrane fusion protein|nr:efflux RND transporter periplasmic adaptor subunit [Methylovirgula sp.]